VFVAAIAIGLFAIDRALASIEQTEILREAESRYRHGMQLLGGGDKRGAITELQRAHGLVRNNREYTLGLIEALLENGSRQEAESRLREVLRDDSNNGRANLLFARLLAAEAKTDEAIAFYHRAIYGTWPSNVDPHRADARIELAEYLGKQQRPQELLSELLLLQARATEDPRLAHKIAGLFLVAGSGSRAADMYHEILRKSPRDARAFEGLGEADLLAGDYRGAESMFLRALRYDPANASVCLSASSLRTISRPWTLHPAAFGQRTSMREPINCWLQCGRKCPIVARRLAKVRGLWSRQRTRR
jgi:tetratricopeptide (TPR) repeat protein